MSTRRHLSRLSATALALVVGALVLVGPLVRPASAGLVPSADTEFLGLLNTLRGTLGLPTLALDSQASSVARAWSQNMASTGVMAHNPDLSTQISSWSKLGENVATGGLVAGIFSALVASPVHMRNMSDGGFTAIGIGTVLDGSGRLWTTHVFLRPGPAAAPARPVAPATTQAPAPPTTKAAPRPRPTAAPDSTPAAAPPTTPAAPAPTVPATTTPPAPPTTMTPTSPSTSSMAILPVEAASSVPTASAPPLLVPVSSTSGPGPAPLLSLAALVGLVALAGAGLLAHRHTRVHRAGSLR